jgi:succinate dehydrogenase flavin-adding protein (antitoxin of CptAB toxin-antitoxin module)
MPYKDKEKHAEYLKQHKRKVVLNLMRSTDSDIIEWLESQPSMQGVVKDAIRYYMERKDT